MKLRIPDFYPEFKCLAGACKHTCCAGWEIDIDEDTWDYFHSVEGSFGDKLRSYMTQEETEEGVDRFFRLMPDGRCPFLNQEGLCEIICHSGEEVLPEVCTEYPRFVLEYADVREKCMALSCEAVGKLLFGREKPLTFPEMEIPGDSEQDEEDEEWISCLRQAQEEVFALLQDRTRPIEERLSRALAYSDWVQEQLDEDEADDEDEAVDKADEESGSAGIEQEALAEEEGILTPRELALKRHAFFAKLELLDEECGRVQEETRRAIEAMSEDEYRKEMDEFLLACPDKDLDYEHILVSYVFRYGMRAVYDGLFADKVRLAAISLLMIRDLELVRYRKNGRHFTLEDRIDMARLFSRQVEHSEENVEELLRGIRTEKMWSLKALEQAI